MTLKSFLMDRLLGRNKLADVKIEAEKSQEDLDSKIDETRASAKAVIIRTREEIKHSERIIKLAEQAVRQMQQVEKHH